MAEKIYVGKARYITFRDGGEKCRIWLTPDGVEDINRNVDNKGGINLVMVEMRDPDRAGNTHTLYVDDWKPDGGQRRSHAPAARRENAGQYRRSERPAYQERQERGNSQARDDGGFGAYSGNDGHKYSHEDCYPEGQTPSDGPVMPPEDNTENSLYDDIPF